MSISFDFSGRAVIVTGAARGIGRVTVHRFVTANALVLAVDRDADGLAETCKGLDRERVAQLVADVSTEDGTGSIVDTAVSHFGRLDVCVNNAAVAPHTSIFDERVEVWDTVYAVNTRGTFLMTRAAAKAMIDAGNGGRIINFSSAAATKGGPGGGAYASSRAATEAFSRVAAIELAPHGILVNVVSPGLIDTQPRPLPPTMAERLGERIPNLPLARPGEPDEVVSIVMFLASDASSYVTGAVWSADGGANIGSRFSDEVIDDDPRYDWVTGRG